VWLSLCALLGVGLCEAFSWWVMFLFFLLGLLFEGLVLCVLGVWVFVGVC